MECRACAGDLVDYFHIPRNPLSGVFPRTKEAVVLSGSLTLSRCTHCGLTQLKETYPLDQMYGDNYGYRSGLNPSMVSHLRDAVTKIENSIALKDGDLVVDIASNDGTLLSCYKNKNLIRYGIDPTSGKFRSYYEEGIATCTDFFDLRSANDALMKFNKQAKVITSFSVFYDVPDPTQFIKAIEHLLSPEGLWISEQSHLGAMLETSSFDTICHEHLEYYSLGVVINLLSATSLQIIDVETNNTNGGSFRFVAAKKGSSHNINQKNISSLLELEKTSCSDKALRDFATRCTNLKSEVRTWIDKRKAEGSTIAALGASTKGNISLSYFQLTSEDISEIGDVNADKHGAYTPGSLIPIGPEDSVLARGYDFLVILPWHFKEFFVSSEKFKGTTLVFFHPHLHVVNR